MAATVTAALATGASEERLSPGELEPDRRQGDGQEPVGARDLALARQPDHPVDLLHGQPGAVPARAVVQRPAAGCGRGGEGRHRVVERVAALGLAVHRQVAGLAGERHDDRLPARPGERVAVALEGERHVAALPRPVRRPLPDRDEADERVATGEALGGRQRGQGGRAGRRRRCRSDRRRGRGLGRRDGRGRRGGRRRTARAPGEGEDRPQRGGDDPRTHQRRHLRRGPT